MKKLIPALCLLLVSAVLMGTSTFAWFSMNQSVSATGMQVVAKSDNTYLLISSTNSTAATIQTENAITTALTVNDEDAKLYPSAPVMSAGEAAYLPATTGKKVGGGAITTAGVVIDDDTKAAAVTNWYTATAAASSAAAMKSGSAEQLTSFSGYVITKTVYLTVAVGAKPSHNLTVTPTFTQKTGGTDLSACKVLLVTDDGACTVLTSTQTGTAVDIKGDNTDLTSSDVLTVTIYIYYDGNDSTVYTNNAANLKGAEISLAFSVEANLS